MTIEWHPGLPDAEECRIRLGRLTYRQLELLTLVAAGWPRKQAASRLGITVKTAHNHLAATYSQLGVNDFGALVALYYRAADASAPRIELPMPTGPQVLSRRQAQAALLDEKGLTETEIADMLDLTEMGVRQLLRQARRKTALNRASEAA